MRYTCVRPYRYTQLPEVAVNELPKSLGLPLLLADEVITLEGWRQELIEGDQN